jgi:hypothetical protein
MLWRPRLRAWRHLLLGGIIGGVAGWLVLFAVTGLASWLAVTVATSIGVLVVMALQRG